MQDKQTPEGQIVNAALALLLQHQRQERVRRPFIFIRAQIGRTQAGITVDVGRDAAGHPCIDGVGTG